MSVKMMTILEADRDIWADSVTHVGSFSVSGKLPTYPSPKPTFWPKWEVSVYVGLWEG